MTCPSKRRRAVRNTVAWRTSIPPTSHEVSASTLMVPEGCPIRIGPAPARDRLLAIVPSVRIAAARHSPPVSGMALCACPTEIVRKDVEFVRIHFSFLQGRGRHRRSQNCDFWDADHRGGGIQIRRQAHHRRCTHSDRLQLGHQTRIGIDVLRHLGSGHAYGISGDEDEGVRCIDEARFDRAEVGNVNPVHGMASRQKLARLGPPGSRNSSRIGEAVPDIPSSLKSPAVTGSPSFTWNRAEITLPVFVFWMRTTVSPLAGHGTSSSSTAKGPMVEDMFPQLPAYSTIATPICAKV